jgi:hypothetical protein
VSTPVEKLTAAWVEETKRMVNSRTIEIVANFFILLSSKKINNIDFKM